MVYFLIYVYRRESFTLLYDHCKIPHSNPWLHGYNCIKVGLYSANHSQHNFVGMSQLYTAF